MTNNLSYAKLIEANAGSGKTYSLTLEYINLLLQGETVDHILATTFTKKAASEILQRVIRRLAEAVIDEKEYKELLSHLNKNFIKVTPEVALKNFVRLQHKISISTMDSFFSKIATSFSSELGFSSKFSISTNDIKRNIISEAIKILCSEEKSNDIYQFLKELNNNSEIKEVSNTINDNFIDFYTEFKNSNKDNWINLKSKTKIPTDKEIKAFIEVILNAECPKKKNGEDRVKYVDLKNKLSCELLNQNWSKISNSSFFSNILKGNFYYYSVEIPQDFINIAYKIIDWVDAFYVNKLNKKINALYSLFEKFSIVYEEIRDNLSTLDFFELKYKLEQIVSLDNLSDIYFRLDTKFRHILLDEFQDTSLEEWKIIQPLISEVLSSIERTFFCVGDPKQAIYAWRGGVSDIFKKISQNFPQVKKEELVKSYRSSQVIIDFVNLICKNFCTMYFEEDFCELINNWNESFPIHEVNNKELPGHVILEVVDNKADVENNDIAELYSEFYDIDNEDNQNESHGNGDDNNYIIPIIIKTCQRIKELQSKYKNISIGVLCRDNKYVLKVISALNKPPYNIDASQEGKVNLIEFKSVIFALSVFKYMAHPGDTLCLFKIKNVLKDKFNNFDNTIRLLKELLTVNGFKCVTSYLYDMIKDEISNQEKAIFKELIDICIEYDRNSNKNIDDFIKFVSAQQLVNFKASNIKIMTIHAAKGLEFDAVILPDLDTSIYKHQDFLIHYYKDRTKNPDEIYLNTSKAISMILESNHDEYHQMQKQERLMKLEEALCLLYVALTRAKQSLTIYVSENVLKKVNGKDYFYSMSAFILQVLNYKHLINDHIYEVGTKDFYTIKDSKQNETNDDLSEKLSDEKFESFKSALKEKNLTIKSPSNEEGEGKCQVKDIFNLKLAHTLKRGNIYHKFFENVSWIDGLEVKKEDFFTNESLNKLKREFNNEFSDVEFNDIFNKFLNSLKYPKIKDRLSKSYYEKLWKADTLEILNEEPFIYRENEIIYKGFIDRVVVGYKNNKISNIEIIDFKTDVVKPQDLNFKANFYEPQINIYKNALIKRYGNNVNIHATLLFILMGEDYNYGNN